MSVFMRIALFVVSVVLIIEGYSLVKEMVSFFAAWVYGKRHKIARRPNESRIEYSKRVSQVSRLYSGLLKLAKNKKAEGPV